MSSHLSAAPPVAVRVRAPGKVNLSLRVGACQDDGYHPLVTIFQAVSLVEEVEATLATPGEGISLAVSGAQAERVPVDGSNLAWRAAESLARYTGVDPDVRLHVRKGVPVAGGMAGGSADAAAALVACDLLWETGLSRGEMADLAAGLGSDVPFGLVGHTAVGTGRGHLLTPAMSRGEFHWAFAVRDEGLSTAKVFQTFDEVVGGTPDVELSDDTELMQALRAGDPVGLGRALHNDLQAATLALAPELGRTLEVAHEVGALGVIVSGSGPTIAALARSRQHALAIAASWTAAGVADSVHCATGPVSGARVLPS
ncbi:4-(cytidine 5'-diphospho)-2-C-methyl-D-erythritol kinase [Oerskovia turbata]|uniref:4-diphosphocytidyl-2-C-methyl-D-erythritol kinase n=1 Tax=Oerskovia turbata TaxID=1713 RepID=A0A4Q1KWE5_9CELL|nr:4-(cytidine 5'-diphospho)-2-C-methyl-D-erythritol kinase [Oerskovia turbata]RXR26860.1 4-(cytidine 5'-diphospho)-2-C-methyl-D-erythritol kinase [Oerskovia turbata]RXR34593.1 4-(cytidine 5'-diphospho)-2-C-methyl-D-erythritol kinase [Oerskovia turbata]TGJ97866.1 4-(cytidine 5'-diphospho)-2-C-methyl-D-erythritol kinase [Actinotalea fermentans ATCC 43279 = JCM 9966 = DSM 3133]